MLVAKHYRDQVYGLTVRWPVGGAMLRSDLAATRLDGGSWKVSGVLNVDYSLVLGGRNLYLFGEYFHNAFGKLKTATDLIEFAQYRNACHASIVGIPIPSYFTPNIAP